MTVVDANYILRLDVLVEGEGGSGPRQQCTFGVVHKATTSTRASSCWTAARSRATSRRARAPPPAATIEEARC